VKLDEFAALKAGNLQADGVRANVDCGEDWHAVLELAFRRYGLNCTGR
jgi:hypothetical protein